MCGGRGSLAQRQKAVSRSRSRIFSEDYPEAAIREGADELTLRAEEVGTLIGCINIDHIEDDRWKSPLVDSDWHAFCEAIHKGIEGEEWEELYWHSREMGASGAKKPSESQEARALWAMKAAKDREEECYLSRLPFGSKRLVKSHVAMACSYAGTKILQRK